jgi:hypothetical protein
MRLLAALAACGVFFAGALWVGSKVFAGEPSSPGPAQSQASEEEASAGHVEQGSGNREKSHQAGRKEGAARVDPHAPATQYEDADLAIARRAVLHADDVGRIWRRVPAPVRDRNGCPENDPDLSGFMITGAARSAFQTETGARTESEAKLFADAGHAGLYFKATNNRTVLRCIRDGVKGWLRRSGFKPRVAYARLENAPPIGTQTAIYLVGYEITLSDGRKAGYPVELLTFQVGRAIGTVSYNLVFSPDGSRPCRCELQEANLVASRLYGD